MIEIDYPLRPSNFVNIGDELTILRRIEATVTQDDHLNWDPERTSRVRMVILWSDERFTYEVRELTVEAPVDDFPVTGTLLRSVPVQMLLKLCINRALLTKQKGKALPLFQSMHNAIGSDPEMLPRMAERGPQPETLQWVARLYTLAKIKLVPPAQYVSDAFEVPLRTASHWIKLARERGQLTI